MNTCQRIALSIMVLGLVLPVVSGCGSSPPPPPPPHTEAEPGPWKDVKVSIPFTKGDHNIKVTIAVTGHPKNSGYVREIELFDQDGKTIGYRVFAAGDVPEETFLLAPETTELTVEITSTGLWKWRSNPRPVPKLQ